MAFWCPPQKVFEPFQNPLKHNVHSDSSALVTIEDASPGEDVSCTPNTPVLFYDGTTDHIVQPVPRNAESGMFSESQTLSSPTSSNDQKENIENGREFELLCFSSNSFSSNSSSNGLQSPRINNEYSSQHGEPNAEKLYWRNCDAVGSSVSRYFSTFVQTTKTTFTEIFRDYNFPSEPLRSSTFLSTTVPNGVANTRRAVHHIASELSGCMRPREKHYQSVVSERHKHLAANRRVLNGL